MAAEKERANAVQILTKETFLFDNLKSYIIVHLYIQDKAIKLVWTTICSLARNIFWQNESSLCLLSFGINSAACWEN